LSTRKRRGKKEFAPESRLSILMDGQAARGVPH
jgi:hypothetical protein